MQPEDVQVMLRERPFKPLQVRLTDGTNYVITHPNLSMVTLHRLIIGFIIIALSLWDTLVVNFITPFIKGLAVHYKSATDMPLPI